MAVREEEQMVQTQTREAGHEAGWTFLSNHSHVLVCLSENAATRLRDVAYRVGITERAVQRIVAELVDAGYLTRSRHGRSNRYTVHRDQPLRHTIEMHRTVGDLLDSLRR